MRSGILPALLFTSVAAADAFIQCYECESATNYSCTEFWDYDPELNGRYLTNCQHVMDVGVVYLNVWDTVTNFTGTIHRPNTASK